MKFFDAKKIILLVFTLLLLIFIALLKVLNLNFINPSLGFLFPVVCFFLITSWIFLIVRYKFNKLWIKIIVTAIPAFILMAAFPYMLLFHQISGEVFYESISPSGKNQVIVFEGGFIDASYSAYPKIARVFYQYQDNGYVAKHDFWGGAEIEVEWKSDDSAYVKVKIDGFSPNEGSNKDDIILVSFPN